jgi:hypothetical protein
LSTRAFCSTATTQVVWQNCHSGINNGLLKIRSWLGNLPVNHLASIHVTTFNILCRCPSPAPLIVSLFLFYTFFNELLQSPSALVPFLVICFGCSSNSKCHTPREISLYRRKWKVLHKGHCLPTSRSLLPFMIYTSKI